MIVYAVVGRQIEMAENNMSITKHGGKRIRQRGLSKALIQLIKKHADNCTYIGDGAKSYLVSQQRLTDLVREGHVKPCDAERIKSKCVVVAEDGETVITAMPVHKGVKGRRHTKQMKPHQRRKKSRGSFAGVE